MDIEPVDPSDAAAFAAWYAVLHAVEQDQRPGEPGWTAQEMRAVSLAALGPERDREIVLLAAHDAGRTVGAARLELPVRDNTHLCELDLLVLPEHRRQGVGRAVFDDVERRLREAGRTTVISYADEPPGRPSAASEGAAERLGFSQEQIEIRRDIPLPIPADLAAALQARSAPYAADYDIVTWRDGVPEPWLDDLAVLHQRMSTDAPLAELEITEEDVDGARVRRHEQLAVEMGRMLSCAGAVHRTSGRLVAYTDMAVSLQTTERAYQWSTIVLTEHRGHRLGTLVKLAALQQLSELASGVRVITTWNAAENKAMIAVNDALGARVNGHETVWQKKLV